MSDDDELRRSLLATAMAALERAAALGAPQARHAATVLRAARRAGRPAIDDAAALAEVARLAAAGYGREAIGIVSRRLHQDPREAAALARRLRRKKETDKRDFVHSGSW